MVCICTYLLIRISTYVIRKSTCEDAVNSHLSYMVGVYVYIHLCTYGDLHVRIHCTHVYTVYIFMHMRDPVHWVMNDDCEVTCE